MNDSEKATLYLQKKKILRKYVNFPFPKEINEGMQEPQREFENSNAEDLKSDIPNDDSKEALWFIKSIEKKYIGHLKELIVDGKITSREILMLYS
ncbi:hypothetical protein TNIN_10691 [Trichonephila inaurata madagascariensis]|uniref:Uncharacterized protein n=1 Tax=Trichonephila inaurata madagascariensis TaxID=2747483 RepID=A0A8X6YRZ4_9ARAC|nr:hypothetical protein TNIN_10691 [Trichonephila inaurata madagascariensis]